MSCKKDDVMQRASGDRSLSFYSVKSALTHHLRSRRWYPSFVRLVRSARRMRLLLEPPDNATSPAGAAVIICASGICPAFNAVQLSDACANLPPAALAQLWTVLTARPFSFSEKKQKQGYAVSAYTGKDCENEWQSTIWKQKS